MTERRPWTREELALALNLYCKLPFGKMHAHNPDIIRLADYLNRTPGSVAMKLVNFASLDPALTQKGLTGCSKLDREVWQDFFADEKLIDRTETVSETLSVKNPAADYSAEDVIVSAKSRRLQSFFRKTILANYETTCCITGIKLPALLVASHIVPWSANKSIRVNPQNGLCLNALHDRAFDQGLITIDSSYAIIISKAVPREKSNAALLDFEGQKITLPKKFLPSLELLNLHQSNVFKG